MPLTPKQDQLMFCISRVPRKIMAAILPTLKLRPFSLTLFPVKAQIPGEGYTKLLYLGWKL